MVLLNNTYLRYQNTVDRDSAYEFLQRQKKQYAQEKDEAERLKAEEKAQAAQLKAQEKEPMQ